MRKCQYDSAGYANGAKINQRNGTKSTMRMMRKMLLPRIKRQNNLKLEKFIVAEINKELKKSENKDGYFDLIQMQFFFESVFFDTQNGVLHKILN